MLHVVLELTNTLVILLYVHRAMVALPVPRGASPAVWGEPYASGPKGRVRRVGSRRRRVAIADALRIIGVWASRATFSLVRPWFRRNEPWIDEACLWAQGVYLVAQHMARQVAQHCSKFWMQRGTSACTEEKEVEDSLPLDRKPPLPGAMALPHATPSTTRQKVAHSSPPHPPPPPAVQLSESVPQVKLPSPAPQPQTLVMSSPATHVSRRTPRSAGRNKATPKQQDTQKASTPYSTSGSPSSKRKRASDEESLVLAHMEARIQAQGEPAAKVRRRAPTSAGGASRRRTPSQTSLLPRPKREHRETPRSSEPGSSRIQTHSTSQLGLQTLTMSSPTSLPLVMQLIVDRELIKSGWTMGPMMAQAAHAASAVRDYADDQVLVQSMERPDTQAYVSSDNLPHMHKIVLQTPKNVSLPELAAQLAAETHETMPPHYLWLEQPENVPTCLAVAPNRKPEVRLQTNPSAFLPF